MNLYKKCTEKQNSFLFNDTKYSCIRLFNYHQIIDEKLQYNINREAVKISALSSGKINKYEYLTGEEILPSDQSRIIKQVNFTYCPLGKAFQKQIKTRTAKKIS